MQRNVESALNASPVDAHERTRDYLSEEILCLSAGSRSGSLLVSFFSIHSQSITMEEKPHDHRSDLP
jgi:hypothetical protein